jgi:hypothetical protein
MGLPEFYGTYLLACHSLMTPVDFHILAKTDASVLPSVYVKTLGIHNCNFEAVPALQGRGSPYGLQDSLPTLNPSCSLYFYNSAMSPRLDTGGWLVLKGNHY